MLEFHHENFVTNIRHQSMLDGRKEFNISAEKIKVLPQVGLEPTTFGLEVQRAIHCATGAVKDYPIDQDMNFYPDLSNH